MRFFRRILQRLGVTTARKATPPRSILPPYESQVPDQPVSFGYKVNWYAVRTTDGSAVAEVLGLDEIEAVNWEAGVEAAYAWWGDPASKGRVFISPPVEGWTFAVGSALPHPFDYTDSPVRIEIGRRFREQFSALSARFEDVQFFGSYRVVDFCAWARVRRGAPVRVFAWFGSDGECIANEGAQTPEERALGLIDLGLREPPEARDYMRERLGEAMRVEEATGRAPSERAMPGEEDVVRLAGAWSIDPVELEGLGLAPSLGLIGALAGEG